MKKDMTAALQKPKQKKALLSKDDIAFISFALDEHTALIERHYSCTKDGSLKLHKERVEDIKKTLSKAKYHPEDANLSEADFWFIDFSMEERCDFLREGIGTNWNDEASEAGKTEKLLGRIRAALGIAPDAEEYPTDLPDGTEL